MIHQSLGQDIAFTACRGKLAEALEKVIKAELIRLGWKLVKTHELGVLTDILADLHSDLLATVEPLADELGDANFTNRYPGFDLDDPTDPVSARSLQPSPRLLQPFGRACPIQSESTPPFSASRPCRSCAPFSPMCIVTAIYENGVFRPLEMVDLPDHARVRVIVADDSQPPTTPRLAAIYEVMAERYDSGHLDTAERHNELQP